MLPINPLARTIVCAVLFAAAVMALYAAGYRAGSKTAARAAAAEKAEIIGICQNAALAAEQQYTEKLAEVAAEKQKWFDFAQNQSAKLAAANRELDARAAAIKEQIPHAVEKDGSGFTGIGADSLRQYGRAFGYTDH